jgi:hypothetical protein
LGGSVNEHRTELRVSSALDGELVIGQDLCPELSRSGLGLLEARAYVEAAFLVLHLILVGLALQSAAHGL